MKAFRKLEDKDRKAFDAAITDMIEATAVWQKSAIALDAEVSKACTTETPAKSLFSFAADPNADAKKAAMTPIEHRGTISKVSNAL